MASTYSTLKIQLMTTGENSTTWGNVTNVNLGTAIEEAIVGSADVTFASNNQTLTLTDTNATQTARNLRLRCTGTTGGSTRNLVVPSIEKPYIVQNDCADSILVKTLAGTGITVPAGKTMWVYSDGTNVVDVVTRLSSLTLGTALPVASGGTGANTALDARTNLGLGTMAIQDGSSVSISGGTITGIADLAVADGGTGASTASGARANLGSTTIGDNLFTLTNPSAVTFPRFNADNTVTALDAASFRGAIGAGTGSGSVTSVGGTGSVNGITLSGTVTTSGNLTLGGALSGVSLTSQVSGTLPIGNGGTGLTSTPTNGQLLIGNGSGFSLATLTQGSGITITNSAGGITIATSGGGGTVTSVSGAGTVNGLTLTGTVTTSGSLTLGGTLSGVSLTTQVTGTLPIANGGTGATTAATAATGLGLGTSSSVQHGSLGIGTAASGTTGEIRATNNITAYYSSDARFKENIQDIEGALDAVCAIGGKIFDWSDQYIAEHGGEDGYFIRKRDFGMIAQDVMKNFPLGGRVRPDETLAVDYEKMCALAFQAIKELRAEVEALKNGAK